MKSFRDLEAVGWIFWLVLLAILAYPGYLVAKMTTYDTSPAVRILFGIILAMLASGLIAWAVNEIIFRVRKRQYDAQRKVERKRKRKKKK
jgi:TRAP-type C4-dicarboxylate transport system permease small subunit